MKTNDKLIFELEKEVFASYVKFTSWLCLLLREEFEMVGLFFLSLPVPRLPHTHIHVILQKQGI